MRSYIEQIEKDLAYEAGSKAQERDRAYFYKLIEESEPIYNGISGPKKLEEMRKATNIRIFGQLLQVQIVWLLLLIFFIWKKNLQKD